MMEECNQSCIPLSIPVSGKMDGMIHHNMYMHSFIPEIKEHSSGFCSSTHGQHSSQSLHFVKTQRPSSPVAWPSIVQSSTWHKRLDLFIHAFLPANPSDTIILPGYFTTSHYTTLSIIALQYIALCTIIAMRKMKQKQSTSSSAISSSSPAKKQKSSGPGRGIFRKEKEGKQPQPHEKKLKKMVSFHTTIRMVMVRTNEGMDDMKPDFLWHW